MADYTIEDVFRQHHDLLEQVEKGENLQALVVQAQAVIEQARRMGRQIKSQQSRQQLATIAAFWAKYVFDNTAFYPETLLYPLDPSAPPLRPAALAFDAGAQAAPGGAFPIIGLSNGAGILLISITQPVSGSVVSIETPFTVGGMYLNLRSAHRLFVMSEAADGVGFVLTAGFAPPVDQRQGMWMSEPITIRKPGTVLLGVCAAVSEAAIQMMSAAFEANSPVEGVPDGTLIFPRLCVLTLQE